MDTDNENTTQQQPNNPAVDTAKNAAARASSEAAKKFAKKSVSSAASNAVRAFILPILPWILGIVIVLIIAIGIIMFFVSGMGLIYDTINKLSESFIEYVTDKWYGSDANVKPVEIIQVADKLESMGYDLYGEGFVTSKLEEGDLFAEGIEEYRDSNNKPINNAYIDQSGIARDEYGITNIDSYLIKRYLISDNYVYTVYNNNQVWEEYFAGYPASDGYIVPRRGLLRLIIENDNNFGTFGGVFKEMEYNGLLGKIYRSTLSLGTNKIIASVDISNKTLDIGTQRGILWWKKTDTLSYGLEGWTGRYGMPLEFLLSLHLACEQPDLVLDMLNTFETHVNIGLHQTQAHFVPGIEISGQTVTLADLNALGTAEEFIKKYYPRHYQEMQEQNGDPDDTTDTTDTTETAEPEPTYEEKLQEIISGSTNSVTLPDGTKIYEVPAGTQGANGATKLFVDEDGNVYYPDEEGEYYNSGNQYDVDNTEENQLEITDEDENVLDFETIRNILRSAAGGNDSGEDTFDTFLPYIRNVSDHWFRDTYFVLGTDSQFQEDTGYKTIRLIKNDKEFEQKVGERWTLYEVDENGNYVLYLVNDDGSVGDKYNGTQEQAINDGLRVTKRAITQLVSERRAEDADFEAGIGPISNSLWSAYDLEGSGVQIDWTQWDEAARDYPAGATDQEIRDKLKYKITIDEKIVQKRDGERSETNAKIKKMLTRYKYYSYDGSRERAEAISKDREANSDFRHEDGYGNILDGTAVDERDQNLVGKFLINAESLSAFKILENMNTLDADQIYRDFKELIVELNYYDKEELAGTDTGVFQWPLPDTGNVGWPVREFSKKDDVYGTLIHSKVDLKNLYEVYSITAESEGQGGGPSAPGEDEPVSMVTDDDYSILGQMFIEQKEALYATQGEASKKMDGEGSGEFGQSTFFDTAQACWDYIVAHGSSISYGALGACPFASGGSHKSTIDCSGFVTWVIYEWGTGEIKSHFSSQRATPALMKDNYEDLFGWTEIKLGQNESALGQLEPGDILVRDNGEGGANGHTAIVKEVRGSEVVGWDCGSASHWQTDCTETTIGAGFVGGDGRIGKIIRIEEVEKAPEKYKGYEGNTDVVSPITGEIIEAGKISIQKNLETNETEEVGYIKLKAMTTEDFEAIDPPKIDDLTDISNLSDDEKNYAGFRYFYDDYKDAGVLGMYIYIEGIDLRIVDEALTLQDDSTIKEDGEYRSRYHKHKFDDVIGEETRNVLKNKERLRDYALSTFTCKVGEEDRIFIKEGTVIGKTYTDGDLEENLSDAAKTDYDKAVVRPCVAAGKTAEYPQMMFSNGKSPNWDEIEDDKKPTGNYMRVILRTAEDGQAKENPETEPVSNNTNKDNIIEDIEDYFELDDPFKNGGQPYVAQPGDLELLASLIHHENCVGAKSYLGTEDGERASKATGYVCVNRALVNFGNHGTTIREQIEAPGQYASKDAVINVGDYCDGCLEMAEWCLTYDCDSISNPSTNEEMTRNTVFQAGFCQCTGSKYHCWWVCDNARDGNTLTEYPSSPWDTFYCKSPQYEGCP